MCPHRRAAEHQQLSNGERKDVAPAAAMLRGATRGAGADGMNTTGNLIGGGLRNCTQLPMIDGNYAISNRSYLPIKRSASSMNCEEHNI
jgi:hypothetical protein